MTFLAYLFGQTRGRLVIRAFRRLGGGAIRSRWGCFPQELKDFVIAQRLLLLRDLHPGPAHRAGTGPPPVLFADFQPMSVRAQDFDERHKMDPLAGSLEDGVTASSSRHVWRPFTRHGASGLRCGAFGPPWETRLLPFAPRAPRLPRRARDTLFPGPRLVACSSITQSRAVELQDDDIDALRGYRSPRPLLRHPDPTTAVSRRIPADTPQTRCSLPCHYKPASTENRPQDSFTRPPSFADYLF